MKLHLRLLLAILLFPVALLGLVGVIIAAILMSTPDTRELKGCITAQMHQVSLCPKDATYIPLKQVSPVAVAAILASEDTTFYQHDGFDWFEIKNSLDRNLHEKGYVRGGSTITQQLAKNVYLSGDKSIMRKLREAFLTYEIEKNFTKDEILEKYLNVVEFGPNIYGIKPAARYYFKKQPIDLNVLEAAFLAFLLPNPKGYHKSFKDKKLTPFARGRVIDIAFRLMKFNKIPEGMYKSALNLVDQFPWSGISMSQFTDSSGSVESSDAPNEPFDPIEPSSEENDEPIE